mmetsp:Transcript_34369/g.79473  ORF Transcript_34369/g.79473 Transcript_34369/m.79473 type:complete len:168 (-) Transcript_34369:190-693(-)
MHSTTANSNASVDGASSIGRTNYSVHSSSHLNQPVSARGLYPTESYPPPSFTPGGNRQPNDLESSAMGVMQRLIQTGELDRLKESLHANLTSCGWRDRMRDEARERIRIRGLDRASVDEMTSELLPMGRAAVPEIIKAELIREIHRSLARGQGGDNINGAMDGELSP